MYHFIILGALMGNQLSSLGNQPANTNLETETISLDLPNDSVELNRSSSSVRDDSVSSLLRDQKSLTFFTKF